MSDILKKIAAPENFVVKVSRKSVVKALNPPQEPFSITLSNLDLLSGRFPVTYLYFYRKPESDNFKVFVDALKSSLAQILDHYYPFAGQIVQNPKTSEPEIICDNNGALIIEAHTDTPLKSVDFYDLNKTLQDKVVSVEPDFPTQIQVTEYSCGGMSIAFTFDHALGDATSFGKFIASWCEMAQKKPLSCIPDHTRHLRARSSPTYQPSLDQNFVRCTMEEIQNMPMNHISLKRLYHIKASSINMLQKLASGNGVKKTKIEAFSAYVWKIMIGSIDQRHEKCRMGWLVDGRERIGKGENLMSNYIGNVLSVAFGEASIEELKEGSISDIANTVHEAISKVNNEDHFLDLIDWIECHRPGLMLAKAVLGEQVPTIVVSSGQRFPVSEVEFGFGRPLLGTVYTSIPRVGVGYMNQRLSAKGDGSWTVSAILWPELEDALQNDPIFHPMSVSNLQL
ncbi:shikimate O-hydroxycinnamoyltransferase [Vigna radiata var. radiata]|uniref:Shikimate O-hydroxycinnamoyltransferase n=1 Tax=Vigna radiata var. radiata TaxID=3916 RepID=A0A1S3V3D3_VIGRR|nr:shikimate O-hydroxycinnamoyltransferase [Vigna radiata var. radiata]